MESLWAMVITLPCYGINRKGKKIIYWLYQLVKLFRHPRTVIRPPSSKKAFQNFFLLLFIFPVLPSSSLAESNLLNAINFERILQRTTERKVDWNSRNRYFANGKWHFNHFTQPKMEKSMKKKTFSLPLNVMPKFSDNQQYPSNFWIRTNRFEMGKQYTHKHRDRE